MSEGITEVAAGLTVSPAATARAGALREIIRSVGADSPRAQQSREGTLGMSDIGSCRSMLARMIAGHERRPTPSIKLAAFVGTAFGDLIERRWPGDAQVPVTCLLPNGLKVSGNADLVDDDGVIDIKTTDHLDMVRRAGPDFEHRAQIAAYLIGLVQSGRWPDDTQVTGALAYFDRSGKDETPFVYVMDLDEARRTLDQVAARFEDVAYALAHGIEHAPLDKPEPWCAVACLAGETEVVTRQGIRPIRDLAGGEHTLLVPAQQEGGMSGQSVWSEHKVMSFGRQPLRTITLRRGRARKTVRATADHLWFTGRRYGGQWDTHYQREVPTDVLAPGDVLRSIRVNTNRAGVILVPAAAAQGFVYGDGTRENVTIFDSGSDKADIAWLFTGCAADRRHRDTHGWHTTYRGIPSLWKGAPDLRETPGFLISWLAGYFAADGSVSKAGQATLSSASRDAVELVRDVCAIAGIGCSPVLTQMRKGTRDHETPLYTVNLRPADLPDWFFLRPSQASRRRDKTRESQREWIVESVEDHGEVEEVYCAVVDGVQAFALSDGLLTHNCAFYTECRGGLTPDVEGLIEDEPTLTAIDMYNQGKAMERDGKKLADQAKKQLVGIQGSTGDLIVYWTHVGEATLPASTRRGYDRLNIRSVNK